jgi:uncharacterized membrane protein (DUF373 family)
MSEKMDQTENECDLPGDEISDYHHDPLIDFLQSIIRFAVRMLAILMTFVIVWGIGDVVYMLWHKLMQPPFMLLSINNIFETFGSFLAVLIAIEIFMNIRVYLGSRQIPVNIVIGTALMAVARKIILLDSEVLSPMMVLSIAAAILALGVTYWMVRKIDLGQERKDLCCTKPSSVKSRKV